MERDTTSYRKTIYLADSKNAPMDKIKRGKVPEYEK
jgi:hypothetical protein